MQGEKVYIDATGRTGIPGTRDTVQLPMIGNPHWLGSIFAALSIGLAGCFGPLMLFVSLWSITAHIGIREHAMVIVTIPAGVLFTAFLIAAIVTVADLLPQPVVTVDAEGIRDRRVSNDPIRWDNVSKATFRFNRVMGVLLELHHPVRTRLNPFRLGTLGFLWRANPNVVYISIGTFVGPNLSQPAILALAALHGAEAFEWFGMSRPRPAVLASQTA